MEPTRIGVLGCGNVSHMYLPNLVGSSLLEVAGIADIDADTARAVAKKYDIGSAVTPEQLIADPSIEIIVNLTPIVAHVAATTSALAAGKHVYSEKPLTTSVAEARGLIDDAKQRGLAITCAPDTLLASGFQTSLAALHAGRIGKPLTVNAAMFRRAMSTPSFYTAGPTPFFDMAPYYVSALIWILGPATRVSGATRSWPTGERPDDPQTGAPIAISGVVEFAGGATASLTLGWGTEHRSEIPVLDVYGTNGVLAFPNPNNFGDAAFVQNYGEREWVELPGSRQPADWPHNLRGLGVIEMALALREGLTPRTNVDLAGHVVDIVASLVESADTGRRVDLTTTCAVPEPVPADVLAQLRS